MNWADDFAYVVNNVSDNVSVIEISSNMGIATVSVGSRPLGIAITPIDILDVSAKTGRDRFLTQTDLFNRISWIPPEVTPTSYEIYSDEALTDLIAVLPGSTTEFIDHNKRKNETSTYVVVAFEGMDEVAKGSVTITTE